MTSALPAVAGLAGDREGVITAAPSRRHAAGHAMAVACHEIATAGRTSPLPLRDWSSDRQSPGGAALPQVVEAVS